MPLIVASLLTSPSSHSGGVDNVCVYTERPGRTANDYYGDSKAKDMPGIGVGDLVYAVAVKYTTGSTFSPVMAASKVIDIFATKDEARRLAEVAFEVKDSVFTHEGVEYYADWRGYFEDVTAIQYWECRVRENPGDPYRDPDIEGPRFLIGH